MNDVQLDIKEQLRGFELWNLKDRIQFPLVYSYTKSSHYRDLGGHHCCCIVGIFQPKTDHKMVQQIAQKVK